MLIQESDLKYALWSSSYNRQAWTLGPSTSVDCMIRPCFIKVIPVVNQGRVLDRPVLWQWWNLAKSYDLCKHTLFSVGKLCRAPTQAEYRGAWPGAGCAWSCWEPCSALAKQSVQQQVKADGLRHLGDVSDQWEFVFLLNEIATCNENWAAAHLFAVL